MVILNLLILDYLFKYHGLKIHKSYFEKNHSSFLKKWSEIIFYKILAKLSSTPIYFRFSGFALIDRKVAETLKLCQEKEPFIRGLLGAFGFNVIEKDYIEEPRNAGKSKYSYLRMFKLALSGITSFSATPIYISFYIGFINPIKGIKTHCILNSFCLLNVLAIRIFLNLISYGFK